MKVCAHMFLSPYSSYHKRFDSAAQAKHWLWDYLYPQGNLAGYDPDHPVGMNIYPQCDQCNSQMNFHDYPAYQFVVGPRGGISRKRV